MKIVRRSITRKESFHYIAELSHHDLASRSRPVESLGLVSPGAATDGVTPIFPRKTDDLFSFFSHRPMQSDDRNFISPPSDVVNPVFFYKLSHKKITFSWVSPLEGVPGAVRPPGYATGSALSEVSALE